MSRSYRVDEDFFDDFFGEDPFITHRRRRAAGRHRKMRQSVRSETTICQPNSDDNRMTTSVSHWEPGPRNFA